MRILVVDDTLSVRIMLASLLRKWGHEVIEADDGDQAWEIIQREPVRFVISDWMMPGLDGPSLCRRVREADFEDYVYFILLTSRDDESDLVEGMNSGADDFVTKPFSRGELEVRIKAGARILQLQQNLAQKNTELSDALGIVRRDLEAAARTQLRMLPANAAEFGPTRFDWLFSPATYIGGDSLGYFPVENDLIAFYTIDVSGHGVPSAMISFTLNRFITPALCRLAVAQDKDGRALSPERVVECLNQEFMDHGDDSFYFTMLFGLHEPATGLTRICQAAHPHPLLVSRGGSVEELGGGGMPVALLEFADFDSFEFVMQPGDRLLMYSDGVTESISPEDVQYGIERFKEFLRARHELDTPALLQTLRGDLAGFRGGEGFDDDLSVLAMQYDVPAA